MFKTATNIPWTNNANTLLEETEEHQFIDEYSKAWSFFLNEQLQLTLEAPDGQKLNEKSSSAINPLKIPL